MTDNSEKILEAIELAKKTGKIKKGTNEATKALERGVAKAVAIAKDVSPAEVTMHIPVLAKEKGIPCIVVATREELGVSAGIGTATAAIAITEAGEAKQIIEELKESKE